MVKRLVVLDKETTGRTVSDGHRLLEVGCVELMDRRRTGRNFHRRINPCRQIDAEAIDVRGIRDADAADAQKFPEIMYELIAFVRESLPVIPKRPIHPDIGRAIGEEKGGTNRKR